MIPRWMGGWLFFLAGSVSAGETLLPVTIAVSDTHRLQRGARVFMNYCSGCHSLQYLRYNRMAEDLGLRTFTGEVDTDLLTNNLIFTSSKPYDPIQNSMPEADARQWFGRLPPDLSLSAREHGPDWIYTYLKSFYTDHKRPFGSNNLLIPDVAMPNVLAPLIGHVELEKGSSTRLILIEPGEMTPQELDSMIQDLVTFLVYAAEPSQLTRVRIGIVVLCFLSLFFIVVWRLKRWYWRALFRLEK